MSNIHYGINKQTNAAGQEYDDSTIKSDLATLKSDLGAEKLKVSTNKTNISVNKAAITAEKTKLNNTRTLVNNLSTQLNVVENTASDNKTKVSRNTTTSVNANTRSKENKLAINTEKARVTANATAIALRPLSIITYRTHVPDLSSSFQTGINIPNLHWPYPLLSFGTVDVNTAFRLINVTMDEDVVIPSTFSVTFMLKAYTTATGSRSEGTVATLNLSSFRIPNKPYYNINRDYKLSAIFPSNYARLGCGQLYMKHNHGNANYSVELVITSAIVQF